MLFKNIGLIWELREMNKNKIKDKKCEKAISCIYTIQ